MIKVLVVHDDPIIQAGLSVAFGRYPDLEVRDAAAADVVVADYANGVDMAARIAHGPSAPPKVVVIAESDREWEIRSALERGVRGYLLAGCALDALAAAVRAVHCGVRHLSPQAAVRLAHSLSSDPFTARQEEPLPLLVKGPSNNASTNLPDIATGP